jgi:hypothetical protein
MIVLQLFHCQQNLFDLVRFGFTFMILYIYPRVTLPGRFVYSVAAACETGISKVMIADLAQLTKPNASGTAFYP